MKLPIRLWGKKRGQRMTGWWLVGRVGEAAFFGALVLLGVAVGTVVIGWQLISPETNVFAVGYGFWLLILISVTFVGIGAVGFGYRLMQVAISAEHRASIASGERAKTGGGEESRPRPADYLPPLDRYIDSPGVQLRYRLPERHADSGRLVLTAILVLVWDAFTIAIVTLLVGRSVLGPVPWGGWLIALVFAYIAAGLTRRFLAEFFVATRVGSTVVEIDRLPLRPGGRADLAVVQHGRMSLKKLAVSLVCEERATYHFGTDVRTESQEIERIPLLEQSRVRVEDGSPLRLTCELRVPPRSMHSFVSPHNAIAWKLVVEGEVSRWPSFCRSFPVVIYPAAASAETAARS